MSSDNPHEAWCPKCGEGLPEDVQRCNGCGYALDGARVYDPKHFVWIAFLLSAMVPIYCSASNWGKVGMKRQKYLWLGGGIVGFSLLMFLFSMLPDTGHSGSAVVAYVINVPLAYWLRGEQRPVYLTAMRLGAKRSSMFKGTFLGIGCLVLSFTLAIGSYLGLYELDLRRGDRLFDAGQFKEAAAVYEKIVRDDPSDDVAWIKLAACHMSMKQWDPAAHDLETYLALNQNAAAYALLAHVRFAQGRVQDAEALIEKARALDPGIEEKLFEGDDTKPVTAGEKL